MDFSARFGTLPEWNRAKGESRHQFRSNKRSLEILKSESSKSTSVKCNVWVGTNWFIYRSWVEWCGIHEIFVESSGWIRISLLCAIMWLNYVLSFADIFTFPARLAEQHNHTTEIRKIITNHSLSYSLSFSLALSVWHSSDRRLYFNWLQPKAKTFIVFNVHACDTRKSLSLLGWHDATLSKVW